MKTWIMSTKRGTTDEEYEALLTEVTGIASEVNPLRTIKHVIAKVEEDKTDEFMTLKDRPEVARVWESQKLTLPEPINRRLIKPEEWD